MSTSNRGCRYDEEFKRTIVNLYQNGSKTQSALCQEYGISLTPLGRRIKQYSTVDSLCLHKITYVLQRDYDINISVGRVYRLMKTFSLTRMSTDKPYRNFRHRDNGECTNHLNQDFNQKAPNMVWASDFTYIKVAVNGITFAS